MKTIWTTREAEHAALEATNEYGEINHAALRRLSNAAWWSGVWFGVAGAIIPAMMLAFLIRNWP